MQTDKKEKQQARDLCLFYLLYGEGLRVSEACQLKNKFIPATWFTFFYFKIASNPKNLQKILGFFFKSTIVMTEKGGDHEIKESIVQPDLLLIFTLFKQTSVCRN